MFREQFFTAELTGNAVLAEGKSREKVTADYWDSLFKRQKGKERRRVLGEHWNRETRGPRVEHLHDHRCHARAAVVLPLAGALRQEISVAAFYVRPIRAAVVGAVDEGCLRDPSALQSQEPPRVVQRGDR